MAKGTAIAQPMSTSSQKECPHSTPHKSPRFIKVLQRRSPPSAQVRDMFVHPNCDKRAPNSRITQPKKSVYALFAHHRLPSYFTKILLHNCCNPAITLKLLPPGPRFSLRALSLSSPRPPSRCGS